MSRAKWAVHSTPDADRDYEKILRWTIQNFGVRQAKIYETTLLQAIEALHTGPDIHGAKQRDDLGPGIRTLHLARDGRKGRHFIVFRVGGDQIIDVLRILYDGMDLTVHLPF